MNTRSYLATAGGAAAGALLIVDLLAPRKRQIVTLEVNMPAPAKDVISLIKQVEREPEFIPLISSVTVHERGDMEARYTVNTSAGLPGSVRYRKWWDEAEPGVWWRSERGAFGFHNEGCIRFEDSDDGCRAILRSEHWITMPFIGRAAARAAVPIIASAMEVWLRRLADELERSV